MVRIDDRIRKISTVFCSKYLSSVYTRQWVAENEQLSHASQTLTRKQMIIRPSGRKLLTISRPKLGANLLTDPDDSWMHSMTADLMADKLLGQLEDTVGTVSYQTQSWPSSTNVVYIDEIIVKRDKDVRRITFWWWLALSGPRLAVSYHGSSDVSQTCFSYFSDSFETKLDN